jgi:hypothetical protein
MSFTSGFLPSVSARRQSALSSRVPRLPQSTAARSPYRQHKRTAQDEQFHSPSREQSDQPEVRRAAEE